MATKLTFTESNGEYTCKLPGTKGVLQVELSEHGTVVLNGSIGGLKVSPIYMFDTTYSLAPICEVNIPSTVTLTATTRVKVKSALWAESEE